LSSLSAPQDDWRISQAALPDLALQKNHHENEVQGAKPSVKTAPESLPCVAITIAISDMHKQAMMQLVDIVLLHRRHDLTISTTKGDVI
jgi:hypothetical protein